MNKRERVMAAVRGERPDHLPSGFWLHFTGVEGMEETINAHMDFFSKTGADLCKVMNENLLRTDLKITSPSDWDRLKPFSKHSKYIEDQIELVKRVADKVDGSAVLLATIHGTVASVSHVHGGPLLYEDKQIMAEHLRANPSGLKSAYEAVGEILAYIAEECLKAGADGIYFAALGGERDFLTDEEFEEYVKPNDLAVLRACENPSCFNILHMCKDNLDLSRFVDYGGEVVNWGVHGVGNPSILEGAKLFPGRAVLGGLDDRSGVLVDGTEEDIRKAVKDVIDTFGTTKFLLGADCTVPSEISLDRLACAVRAAAEYEIK